MMKRTTYFFVRMEVLIALNADPLWSKRAQECHSTADLKQVIADFSREKGFRVKDLDTPEGAA